MKKFLFCAILVILFVSCSNSGNVTYTGADGDTLKQVVKNKEEAAIWTRELESVRLTKNLRQIDSVSDSITLNPDVMKLSRVQSEKIYPMLKDFGSLDVSDIPESVYKSCNDFASSLSKDLYSVQSYFNSSSLFSYIFFLDDLKNNFFDGSLPKKSESKADSEIDENTESDVELILDRYVIGKSFESGEEFQIPIRFYKGSNYFDTVIYISGTNIKISQIKIDRCVKM